MPKRLAKPYPSQLRVGFVDSCRAPFSFSQAWQDIFVLVALNGLTSGTYLEIGAGDARSINNTYLLERYFGWKGISLDIDKRALRSYKVHRRNPCLLMDACRTDFSQLFTSQSIDAKIDYLQVDIEPSTQSLIALERVMSTDIRPRVITFETDYYDLSSNRDDLIKVREASRNLLSNRGYLLVAGDVGSTSSANPFEDWYVDPSCVDLSRLSRLSDLATTPQPAEVLLFEGPHIIASEFYRGQGLGNQLWSYVVTRILAEQQGFQFGIVGRDKFKGKSFMGLDNGIDLAKGVSAEGGPPLKLPTGIRNYYSEMKVVDEELQLDVSGIDTSMYQLSPNTKIDGNFQSYSYLEGNEDRVRSWFTLDQVRTSWSVPPKQTCVVHVRGGDFKNLAHCTLGAKYYEDAVTFMGTKFGITKFLAVTDDPEFAATVLPKSVEIISPRQPGKQDKLQARHHIGVDVAGDFATIVTADYLIISNSSFAWWAAFLNTKFVACIAPKYWSAHNLDLSVWSTSDIITPRFTYLDSNGRVFSAEECKEEQRRSTSNRSFIVTGGSTTCMSFPQFLKRVIRQIWYVTEFNLMKWIGQRFSNLVRREKDSSAGV
jgi:Glycosyl transferase family 11